MTFRPVYSELNILSTSETLSLVMSPRDNLKLSLRMWSVPALFRAIADGETTREIHIYYPLNRLTPLFNALVEMVNVLMV